MVATWGCQGAQRVVLDQGCSWQNLGFVGRKWNLGPIRISPKPWQVLKGSSLFAAMAAACALHVLVHLTVFLGIAISFKTLKVKDILLFVPFFEVKICCTLFAALYLGFIWYTWRFMECAKLQPSLKTGSWSCELLEVGHAGETVTELNLISSQLRASCVNWVGNLGWNLRYRIDPNKAGWGCWTILDGFWMEKCWKKQIRRFWKMHSHYKALFLAASQLLPTSAVCIVIQHLKRGISIP